MNEHGMRIFRNNYGMIGVFRNYYRMMDVLRIYSCMCYMRDVRLQAITVSTVASAAQYCIGTIHHAKQAGYQAFAINAIQPKQTSNTKGQF